MFMVQVKLMLFPSPALRLTQLVFDLVDSPVLWKNAWAELRFISLAPLVSVAVKLKIIEVVVSSIGFVAEIESTVSIVGAAFEVRVIYLVSVLLKLSAESKILALYQY